MTDRQFDSIFEKKLANYGEEVDGAVWEGIVSSLDAIDATGKKLFKFNLKRIISYTGAAAAVIILALFLFLPEKNNPHIDDALISARNSAELDYPLQNEVLEVMELEHPDIKELLPAAGAIVSEEPDSGTATAETGSNPEEVYEEYPVAAESPAQDPDTVSDEPEDTSVPTIIPPRGYLAEDFGYLYGSDDRKKKKLTLAVNSSVLSGQSNTGSMTYIPNMSVSGNGSSSPTQMISDAEYSLPLAVGAQIQIKMSESFSIGVGLNYSMLHSKYEILSNARYYSVNQKIHYLGVPVNAYYTLFNGHHFYSYVNGGFAMEKGLRVNYKFKDYSGNVTRSHESISNFLFSANIGLGIEWRFSNPFGIYFEPNLVYYFNSKIPASIRTDQPLQFRGEIGLRFHLR